jgi:hypothetical protein
VRAGIYSSGSSGTPRVQAATVQTAARQAAAQAAAAEQAAIREAYAQASHSSRLNLRLPTLAREAA